MTPLQYFRIVAPEFSAVLDADVNAFLTMAPLFIDVSLFDGETANLATALKAASLMLSQKKSASGSSSGGAIIEEKEGDLMRKYSEANALSGNVDIYEQQLNNLSLGICGAGIMTRIR